MTTATISAVAEPTREQQQLAYSHMARPGWPPTLEAALAIYSYRTAINGLARRLHRPAFGQRTGPGHTLPKLPAPPTPTEPPPVVRGKAQAAQTKALQASFTGLPEPLGTFPRTTKGPGWLGCTATNAPGAPDRKRLAANDRDE